MPGMETEYEAKFLDVDKDEMRARLKAAGATLKRPEFMQKRWVLDLPPEAKAKGTWVRVRDKGDKITMSYKSHQGTEIQDQKELMLVVDSFDNAVEFLQKLGCPPESYQESMRELWILDGVEITIDTWPFMEPLVEVEGRSEAEVREAAIKIGFDWSKALFCGVNKVFQMKYGPDTHIRRLPRLTFDMLDPFLVQRE